MLFFEPFLFFRFLFSIFSFCLLLYQAIFRWCVTFLRIFFLFLRRALHSTWKMIVFNQKAVVKISRISNSKNPPWHLVVFHREFFLMNISIIMCWIFEFWFSVNGESIKKPAFYSNTHSHICCIIVTEIQYLQIADCKLKCDA